MALTSTHDGQGNVILYGGTATHDNMGNVVLTVAATDGGTAIAEDEVSLSLVDTSGYAEHEEVAEAAKTATDYVDFEEGKGLVVGDLRENGKLGKNVLVDSDSVDIRDGEDTLASFAEDRVELGKKGIGSAIDLCDGAGIITASKGKYNGGLKRMEIAGGDSTGIVGGSGFDVSVDSSNVENTGGQTAHTSMILDSYDTFTKKANAQFNIRSQFSPDGDAWYSAGISAFISKSEDPDIPINPYLDQYVGTNITTMYGDRTEFSEQLLSTAATTPFRHYHPTTGRGVGFGVGSGGSYAGLYDLDKNGWVMRFDQTDLSLRGPNGLYKPYFTAGDTFSVTIRTAGYCTSSKSQVQYCIPLGKPVIGVSSVSVTTDADGGYKLRQDGNYTHGSGQSTYMRPNSHSVTYSPKGMVFAIATFGNTTNAVNNDAIGIEAVINVTFNA